MCFAMLGLWLGLWCGCKSCLPNYNMHTKKGPNHKHVFNKALQSQHIRVRKYESLWEVFLVPSWDYLSFLPTRNSGPISNTVNQLSTFHVHGILCRLIGFWRLSVLMSVNLSLSHAALLSTIRYSCSTAPTHVTWDEIKETSPREASQEAGASWKAKKGFFGLGYLRDKPSEGEIKLTT